MDAASAVAADSATSSFIIPYDYLYEQVFGGVRPLYFVLIFFWICLLFYAMYSIADRHFTWSLEQLSQSLRLSPDLAGMTLLAFGNGAPDFFTAVFGASEEPEMILGSSVGAGLFTITVVFGLSLLMAKRPGERRKIVVEEGLEAEAVAETSSALFRCASVRHSVQPLPYLRATLMYLLCVLLLGCFALIGRIPFWLPLILVAIFLIYLGLVIAVFAGKRLRRTPSKASAVAGSIVSVTDKELVDARKRALESFQRQSFARRARVALRATCWDADGDSGGILQCTVKILLLLIKGPVNLLLNMTILPVEIPEDHLLQCSPFSVGQYVGLRFLHRLRCVVNPFFSLLLALLLLWRPPTDIPWYIWTAYGATSSLLSVILWLTTSWDGAPRAFALHVLAAFCMAILWIYAVSNELLSALSSTGTYLGISPTIMGIIVLAWGNSFGDLVADVATARNGAFETAITAVFSSPVQNVLLTIGVAFLIAALKSPTRSVLVASLSFDIYLALAVLLGVLLLCILLVPLRYDFCIPRNFGFTLLVIYMLYFPIAVLTGLGIVKVPLMRPS